MSADPAPVRSKDRFLTFAAPLIGEEEIEAVVATLRSGWLGTGPRVARFEAAFAAYKGVGEAAAVGSCTAAMHLALLARGIGPGDEVIVPALTFCSTANVVLHTGARPVPADVLPGTLTLDPDQVERRITPRTRVVIPVHFAGRPCDMDRLLAIARARDLLILEDCAHAIETEYRGRKAGTMGDLGCFSFYVTKNVVTGEGGMVLSRRQQDLRRVRVLALHGLSGDAWKRYSDDGFRHYQVVECGYKCNMTDLQAAIGLPQLERVESSWRRREAVWRRYQRELRALPVGLPPEPEPETRHAYHLYQVRVDRERAGIERDAFLDAMTRQGIGVGVHYLSLAEHPYYREHLGWKPEDYPVALRAGRETVSLPLSARLSDADVGDVIEAVRRVLPNAT
jgi:dTDP-4-amino-4,6-dideoxygalactose transaminase